MTLRIAVGTPLFYRKECDTVAADLSKTGIQAVSYHAGLGDGDRVSIQEKWLNGQRCKVSECIPSNVSYHTILMNEQNIISLPYLAVCGLWHKS
jgi:hypothetical protein